MLAESTVEVVAGVAVAAVLALITGWAVCYKQVKAALRREWIEDAEAERADRKKDAEIGREIIEKDNSLWRAECDRLIQMHMDDRARWIEELHHFRQMVKHAEDSHVECRQEVAKLRQMIEKGVRDENEKTDAGG